MGFKEIFNLARVPSILMLGGVYMTYVLIGGLVFWKLEGELGGRNVEKILENKRQLLNKYTCLNQESLLAVVQVRHWTHNMENTSFLLLTAIKAQLEMLLHMGGCTVFVIAGFTG